MNLLLETTSNSSGSQANKTGNALESFVEGILERNGYTEFINHKKQIFFMKEFIGGKQFSKQSKCGKSIYDTDRRCDFLVMNPAKHPRGLIIECKWQETSGSVDEKYPFAVLNIAKIGTPTIVLIDGKGYKQKAFEWFKKQAAHEQALRGVYTMNEFQKLVNRGFL
ncbi:MAG: hypothetical protein LBB26_03940 [Puniceicoccales bacterium]|jgi:hypothetical protein|nr:hypothetical protein [Puniceicoccales bacterium]